MSPGVLKKNRLFLPVWLMYLWAVRPSDSLDSQKSQINNSAWLLKIGAAGPGAECGQESTHFLWIPATRKTSTKASCSFTCIAISFGGKAGLKVPLLLFPNISSRDLSKDHECFQLVQLEETWLCSIRNLIMFNKKNLVMFNKKTGYVQ